MTDPVKRNETNQQLPTRRIVAEALGCYRLIDSNKVYSFEFPVNSTIEDNLSAISYLKEEILKSINAKAEEEKKVVEKETVKEDTKVESKEETK